MKKSLQDQYQLIKEGKGHKGSFLAEVKRSFPLIVRNAATFDEAARVLKDKNIISENIVGIQAINQLPSTPKLPFEIAYENFLKEAKKKEETDKAEAKKPAKQVEEKYGKTYDNKDMKNIDNLIFDQVMTGYYAELKDPKNADKTMEELKSIVMKNLEKDPIHYTKDGQFGTKGLGYSDEHPGLGKTKEVKGKYASSGMEPVTLKENKQPIQKPLHEIKLREAIRSIIAEEMGVKPLNENLPKRLKEIENESIDEVKTAKLNKLKAEIEKRQSQLDMIEGNEDLKELTDKNKIKSLHKEIKLLEKAIAKLEKTIKVSKKEVIDEVEEEQPSENYTVAKRDLELDLDRKDDGNLTDEDIDFMVDDYQTNAEDWKKIPTEQIPMLKQDLISKYLGTDIDEAQHNDLNHNNLHSIYIQDLEDSIDNLFAGWYDDDVERLQNMKNAILKLAITDKREKALNYIKNLL
jgi:hypothetical protein